MPTSPLPENSALHTWLRLSARTRRLGLVWVPFRGAEVQRGPGPRCSWSRIKPRPTAHPQVMDEQRVACADRGNCAVVGRDKILTPATAWGPAGHCIALRESASERKCCATPFTGGTQNSQVPGVREWRGAPGPGRRRRVSGSWDRAAGWEDGDILVSATQQCACAECPCAGQ